MLANCAKLTMSKHTKRGVLLSSQNAAAGLSQFNNCGQSALLVFADCESVPLCVWTTAAIREGRFDLTALGAV